MSQYGQVCSVQRSLRAAPSIILTAGGGFASASRLPPRVGLLGARGISANTLTAQTTTLSRVTLAETRLSDAFRLALQLRFLRSSESIGHHDSEIVDNGYFDRDDAGALGVIGAGCQSADGAIVHPGAGGGFCGLIRGRTTRRRAAQDRLDAGGSGGGSGGLGPAGPSGARMVGR